MHFQRITSPSCGNSAQIEAADCTPLTPQGHQPAAPSGEGRPLGTAAEQTVVCTSPIAAHVHDEKCRSERNSGH